MKTSVNNAAAGVFSAVLTFGIVAGPASAQDDFPTEPITVVVGYGAGGGTDAMVRAVVEPLSDILGQPVLVQNVPGAGGGVAATRVVSEPADGHTILATTSSTFTLEPQLQELAYEPDDFRHVMVLGNFQGAIFARSDFPHDDIRDVIEEAKDEDKAVNYASFFQLDRMVMSYIGSQEGVEFVPVPVQGGNGALQAVLSGDVPLAYSGGTWGPHVESGDIKLLFATSTEPLVKKPDVPTMSDLGYDIGTTSLIVLSVHADTPDAIVQKLNDALKTASETEMTQRVAEQRFMPLTANTPEESEEIIAKEQESFETMLEAIN